MKYPLMFLLALVSLVGLKAQDDLPVNDEEKIEFVPGIYSSFEDFISNSPVDVVDIEGDVDQFFNNPMNSKKITLKKKDSVFQIEQHDVWGYTDSKDVFLNRALFKGMNLDFGGLQIAVNPWVKIQKLGKLSFILFLTTIRSQDSNRGGQPLIKSVESNYILNTRDGHFYSGNLKQLKLLITDDPELLETCEKERGDDQVKFFTILDRYNKRHPFQFH
jgi:hypothetical protein